MKIKTGDIVWSPCDEYYGGFLVWNCKCGNFNHGVYMVVDRNHCLDCGAIAPTDEQREEAKKICLKLG